MQYNQLRICIIFTADVTDYMLMAEFSKFKYEPKVGDVQKRFMHACAYIIPTGSISVPKMYATIISVCVNVFQTKLFVLSSKLDASRNHLLYF